MFWTKCFTGFDGLNVCKFNRTAKLMKVMKWGTIVTHPLLADRKSLAVAVMVVGWLHFCCAGSCESNANFMLKHIHYVLYCLV